MLETGDHEVQDNLARDRGQEGVEARLALDTVAMPVAHRNAHVTCEYRAWRRPLRGQVRQYLVEQRGLFALQHGPQVHGVELRLRHHGRLPPARRRVPLRRLRGGVVIVLFAFGRRVLTPSRGACSARGQLLQELLTHCLRCAQRPCGRVPCRRSARRMRRVCACLGTRHAHCAHVLPRGGQKLGHSRLRFVVHPCHAEPPTSRQLLAHALPRE